MYGKIVNNVVIPLYGARWVLEISGGPSVRPRGYCVNRSQTEKDKHHMISLICGT